MRCKNGTLKDKHRECQPKKRSRCARGSRRNSSGECIVKIHRTPRCPSGSRKQKKNGQCIPKIQRIGTPLYIKQYETKLTRF